MNGRAAALLLLSLLAIAGPSRARTWIVDAAGQGDYTTITECLAAAASGDTLQIQPGQYDENPGQENPVHVTDKVLSIIGVGSQPEDVSLTACLVFSNCGASLISNVQFHDSGYPLEAIHLTDMTIRRCDFTRNTGSALYAGEAALHVEDCTFSGNTARPGQQGGSCVNSGSATYPTTIQRSVFKTNQGPEGGAIRCEEGLTVEDCVFFRNRAERGAAVAGGVDTSIKGCTFVANEVLVSWPPGATLQAIDDTGWFPDVKNCIVAKTVNGFGIECWGPKVLECCDLWMNEKGDFLDIWCYHGADMQDFAEDPLFCDEANGDLNLLDGSPCLSHGTCGLVGARGVGCAGSPTQKVTWGRIKLGFK